MTVARLFWLVAGIDLLILVALAADAAINPHGQFAGLLVVMLLAMIALLGVVALGVALIRRPAAYWIGLALVIWPPVYWAVRNFGY
jgi:hypothetical protein